MNLLSLYRGGSPPGANSPNRLVCYHYPGPILYVGFIHEWMSGGELIVIIVCVHSLIPAGEEPGYEAMCACMQVCMCV